MAAGFAIFAMRLHHVMAHLHREEKQCPRCALLISRQDQWRSQPKIGGGAKCLILGEQQYFVWDTASQSTKWLNTLKIVGGYAYDQNKMSLVKLLCRRRSVSMQATVFWYACVLQADHLFKFVVLFLSVAVIMFGLLLKEIDTPFLFVYS